MGLLTDSRIPGVLLLTIAAGFLSGCDDEPAPGENRPLDSVELAAPPEWTLEATGLSADSILEVGLAVYDRGEFDRAASLLETAAIRADEENDSRTRARALTWLGNAARHLGRYDDSRRYGEQALALKRAAGLADLLWRSYNALGLLAWREARLVDAAALYDMALAAADHADDPEATAKVANNVGLVHFDLGNFHAARAGFERLREAAERLGLRREVGEALSNLGMLETALGDPRSAIPKLQEARAIFQEITDPTREQVTLGHLGSAYLALGDVGGAHAVLDTALSRSRAAGLRAEEAQNLELLAGLYSVAGDRRRALRHWAEAREINLQLQDDLYAGIDLRNEALAFAALDEFPTARQRALEALQLHSPLGALAHELADRLVLAEVAARQGDTGEVERQLDAGSRLTEVLGVPFARIDLALTRARIADHAERSADVIQALNSATPDLAATDYATEWEVEALRARALLRLDQLDRAVAAGERAVRALDRTRGTIASSVLRTTFASARRRTYSDLVSALLRAGDPVRAFEVADAARARAITEHLAAGSGTDPMIEAFTEGQEALRQVHQLASALEGATGEIPPEETAAELRIRLRAARQSYEDHVIRAAESGRVRATSLGIGRVRLTDVQAALAPDETLLEYFVAPDRVIVFVITSDGLSVATTPIGERDLVSRVRVARELLAQHDMRPEDAYGVLHELYERLIEPAMDVSPVRGRRAVLVVPHGPLAYLPFGALRDPVTERYLAEDQAIGYLPSAGSLLLLRGSSRPSSARFTASGLHAFAPTPDQLPATVAEVEAIREIMPNTIAMLGEDAREAEVREALSSGRIVHFAGHAELVPENPLFSWLKLAPGTPGTDEDGRLEVHEVFGITIRAPLVFLSGCETGLGRAWANRFIQGEDYATLSQAFLHAGARSVAATLWRVEDDGAAGFATEFYRALAGGAPTAAGALAQAQRALMATKRFASPYYWAGYRVTG